LIFGSKTSDRWIAVIIWITLLVALLFSSGYAVSLPGRNGWVSYFPVQQDSGGQVIVQRYESNLSIFLLVVIGVLIFLLVRAWLQFAQFSVDLVAAYAKPDEEGEYTLFVKFLKLSNPVSALPRTEISNVLRSLAYVWATMIILSNLTFVVTGLFRY